MGKSAIRAVAQLSVLLVLALGGCATPVTQAQVLAPGTPTCAPGAVLNTPDPRNTEARFVVVLVQVLQYEQYQTQIFDLINSTVIPAMRPGDRLMVLRLGVAGKPGDLDENYDNAVLTNLEVHKMGVSRVPTRQPYLVTDTPMPTEIPAKAFFKRKQQQEAASTATAIAAATSQAIDAENRCIDSRFENSVATASAVAAVTSTALSNDFAGRFGAAVTPTPAVALEKNDLTWGLKYAGYALANYCPSYTYCHVVIFSDMEEKQSAQTNAGYQLEVPRGLLFTGESADSIRKKTDVFGAMLNCLQGFEPRCKKWQDAWRIYFDAEGLSKSQVSFTGSEMLANRIEDLLGR